MILLYPSSGTVSSSSGTTTSSTAQTPPIVYNGANNGAFPVYYAQDLITPPTTPVVILQGQINGTGVVDTEVLPPLPTPARLRMIIADQVLSSSPVSGKINQIQVSITQNNTTTTIYTRYVNPTQDFHDQLVFPAESAIFQLASGATTTFQLSVVNQSDTEAGYNVQLVFDVPLLIQA
ncbi:MAG: hypothetical protein QXV17_04615 [Candidatus Micrarchaeaceae archaeon]